MFQLKNIFLLLLVCFSIIETQAQLYSFKSYSIEDGLPQSQVYAICQDSRGNMWFGTKENGVFFLDSSYVGTGLFIGGEDTTGSEVIVTEYELFQNYPNPFNSVTTIKFNLPTDSNVSLTMYNCVGEAVRALVNREINAGKHDVIWDGRNDHGIPVSSGLYLYRLQAGNFSAVKKMILIR